MKISSDEKPPRYCVRCGRNIDAAIRDQVEARHCCDDEQCVFRKEIQAALDGAQQEPAKPKFTINPIEKPAVKFKIVPLR